MLFLELGFNTWLYLFPSVKLFLENEGRKPGLGLIKVQALHKVQYHKSVHMALAAVAVAVVYLWWGMEKDQIVQG